MEAGRTPPREGLFHESGFVGRGRHAGPFALGGRKSLCSGELPDKAEIRREIETTNRGDIQRVAQGIFRTGNLNLSLIRASA